MEIDKAIGLIEAHGVFHGDHYSFNSDEFVQWCEQDAHQTLSLDQANHELRLLHPGRLRRAGPVVALLSHLDAGGGRNRPRQPSAGASKKEPARLLSCDDEAASLSD